MDDDLLHQQFQRSLRRGNRAGPDTGWAAVVITSYAEGNHPGWRNSLALPRGWVLPPAEATQAAEAMLMVHKSPESAVEAGCALSEGLAPMTHEIVRNGQHQRHFHD